ncbi:hypothetical protein Y032_0002g914 [Ancylostoma ceylanicum]|uniref:Prominin n=1 Tax=Ancylostoma ceylanicum TaxID=53326 RepID=A0A016W1Y5_9BILA|nr:hypothetical protein Y032_0002g914 [Ancylostoma ceylanicum]
MTSGDDMTDTTLEATTYETEAFASMAGGSRNFQKAAHLAGCNKTLRLPVRADDYDIGFWQSYAAGKMQSFVGEISVEQSRRMIAGAEDGALWDVALTRSSLASHFGFGIFMACLLIALGVVLLVRRSTAPSKQYNSGLLGIIISLLLLVISFIFMLVAIISMAGNASLSKSGVQHLAKKIKDNKTGLSAPLQIHADHIICLLESYSVASEIAEKVKVPLESCMSNVDAKFSDIDGTQVIHAIADLKKDAMEIKRIVSIAAEEIVPILKEVSTEFMEKVYITDIEGIEKMNVFDQETSNIPTYFDTIQSTMAHGLDHFHRSCGEVLDKLLKSVKGVEKRVNFFLSAYGANSMASYLIMAIWFPIGTATICLLTIIALIVRAIVNHVGSISFDETAPSRGKLSRIAAEVINVFAYIVIVISAVLFIMFSFGLLFGFGVMASVSGPLKDLQVYEETAISFKSKFMEETADIKLMDILAKCQKGEKFFNAVELNQILSPESLRKTLEGSIQKKSYQTIFLKNLLSQKIYFSKLLDAAKDINSTLSRASYSDYKDNVRKPVTRFKDKITKLATNTNALIQKISNAQQQRTAIVDLVTDNLEKAIDSLVKMYSKFLDQIKKQSAKCDDLSNYRPTLGKFIYAHVAAPAQGQWLSCLVAAIFSIVAFCGLLTSVKHFKSFASSDSQIDFEDDAPEKRLKTVQNAQNAPDTQEKQEASAPPNSEE